MGYPASPRHHRVRAGGHPDAALVSGAGRRPERLPDRATGRSHYGDYARHRPPAARRPAGPPPPPTSPGAVPPPTPGQPERPATAQPVQAEFSEPKDGVI